MHKFSPVEPLPVGLQSNKKKLLSGISGRYITAFFLAVLFAPLTVFSQAPAISYQTPQSYPVNTAITPLTPTNKGGAVSSQPYGQVSTFAGTAGVSGTADGYGTAASFWAPHYLATGKNGNLYLSDQGRTIRKITPAGLVSTFASGFDAPSGVAVDAAGNIYVADSNTQQIMKITPAGIVSIYAGSGIAGSQDGPAANAQFNVPMAVAMDAAGNVYVTDSGNETIRKITPSGMVSTFAGAVGMAGSSDGQGSAASFNVPFGIAIDASGNLIVTDFLSNLIRKVTPGGYVSTIAGYPAGGSNDGIGGAAGFNHPQGAAVDAAGNIYISDTENQLIRRITPDGTVTTIAGIAGRQGLQNGISTQATFNYPIGLALNSSGDLFIGDDNNFVVREIKLSGYTIDKPLPAGMVFNTATGAISGTPTSVSPPTDYHVTAYNGMGISSTTVNIQVTDGGALKPSIITLPPPILTLDANNDYNPHATSTNNETPIIYTSSNPAVAVIDATGLVHIVGPGTTIITATQAGDANYSPAVPVSEILNVMETQVIQFPALAAATTCSTNFPAGATSTNPDIPLTYSSSNTSVATISSAGIIHITGPGTTSITISQAGDSLFVAAPSQSQILTVTSPPTPVVTISYNNNTSICAGTPVTFSAAVTNGDDPQYQWQLNGANIGSNSASLTLNAVTSADHVQCTVTNNGACVVSGQSNVISGINVIAYTTPSVTIQASPAGPVCYGALTTFTATLSGMGTNPYYQWQVNGVNTGPENNVFSSSSLNNGDVVTCIVSGSNSPCLTTTAATSNEITMSVNPVPSVKPSVTISPDSFGGCEGMSLTYTATAVNAGNNPTYQWMVNGQNAGTNSPEFTSSTLKTGDQITCTITSSALCSIATATSNTASLTADPYVNNAVTISSSASGNIISPGESVTFTAKTEAVPSATTTIQYTWQVNNVNAGSDSPVFTTSDLKNGDVVGCMVLTYGKCIATPVVYSNLIAIIIQTPVIIVNTFTPNGDGVNDTWDIPSLAAYPGCTVNVFTRYGTLVYNTTGYTRGWDGTYKGKPLPTGSYYYIIDLKNGKPPLSGPITIIR